MDKIEAVIDQDAYEWISLHHPYMIDAIQYHLKKGASPEQIRRYIQGVAEQFAIRCQGAARHMCRVEED